MKPKKQQGLYQCFGCFNEPYCCCTFGSSVSKYCDKIFGKCCDKILSFFTKWLCCGYCRTQKDYLPDLCIQQNINKDGELDLIVSS